ncbi:hypothetical protein EW145_g403 [Phellinidium pouzarii]|uniref:FHF complex subunit HOOK-interacting protein C-terminal domain-containing protein n=1 Tax=Phellinidium pouzarii TaxID=167371 RepID=A0A4S4LJ71_9AGAM|nr:hypothetical protein EW145_g403 [Phellinidium pouzarii]
MDYFSKFLRSSSQQTPKQALDHAAEFHKSWDTLTHPDERQLARGISATDVPAALKSMVDSLVWESTRTEEGLTGACMEYLLKNDVSGTLVRLSEPDRPSGIQAEVLRTVQNMVVLLDEQFLVHSVVHRAVLRLLRTCVGDDIQEQLDGRNRVMGAAGNAVRTSPSEYEEDLVDLLCLLCSRIRTFRELLMIFFYDKHWYHSETLTSVPEEDEDEEHEEDDAASATRTTGESSSSQRSPSPTPSQATVTSVPASSHTKKPEYEFILFNYLLRFVHREGKIGEFARAGLLFLMDVAMSPGVPLHRLGGDAVGNVSTSTFIISTTSSSSSSASASFQSSQATASDPVADAALALAEYILDGDFCEVLGAGLGAVYSLLPSKLRIHNEPQETAAHHNTMTIGGTGPLSEEDKDKEEMAREKARAEGLEFSSSPEFKTRLEHFVGLLEFLQDVLRRNVSANADDGTVEPISFVGSAIVQSILDAVRRIFLENVLYPSILECSDSDGSAVAVMSYIDVMFRTLRDAQFAEMLIDFLVSEDSTESSRRLPHTQTTLLLDGAASAPPPVNSTRAKKMKRRKSSAMILLEMEAPDAQRQSEYFTSLGRFTLKDLLLTNMRSKSHATVMAALQLMQSLLLYHCHLTVDRLFISSYDPLGASSPLATEMKSPAEEDEESFTYPGAETEPTSRLDGSFSGSEPVSRIPETSYSMHERELGLYLGLVARIDPTHGRGALSTGYEHYLRDALASIASHSCSSCVPSTVNESRPRHLLDVNDPLLSLILQSLRHFYSNTPELNMALTGMLAAIACCPERSLKGWLLFGSDGSLQPLKAETEDSLQFLNDGDDRSVDFAVNERLSRNELPMPIFGAQPLSQPVILSILQGLISNLDRFRELVENFDSYLTERRLGLLFSENLTDALSLTFDMSNNITGVTDTLSASRSLDSEVAPSAAELQKLKPKSKSGWVSFLSPRKNKTQTVSPTQSNHPTLSSRGKTIEASPFGSHYQRTSTIKIEPLVAPLPSSGPWVPAEKRAFNLDEEDVFGASEQWGEEKRVPDGPAQTVEGEATVKKTRPSYEIYAQQPRKLRRVPRLAYFCIKALSDFPEQVYLLGSSRLHFSKDSGGHNVLRSLFPTWKTPDFSLLDIDPRLWATLVQVYANPPSLLSSYPIQLSDPHLQLLQQIPSTPDFTLVTILNLQRCNELSDNTILNLKQLHNLNLRDTRCSAKDYKEPFHQINDGELFDLPMDELIRNLAKNHKQAFSSHRKPYLLSVQKRLIQQQKMRKYNLPISKSSFPSSMHNSFVVLPPSEGMARTGPGSQIQFGNADTIWIQEKKAVREERSKRIEAKEEPGEYTVYASKENETVSYSSEEYSEDSEEEDHSDSSTNALDTFIPISKEPLTRDSSLINNFYKQRPHTSPTRKPIGRSSHLSDDVTFIRDPSPWYTLDSLTQEVCNRKEVVLSSGIKRKHVGINVGNRGEEKAAMQDWQAALVKRRKSSLIKHSPESTHVAELSSTPSMAVFREPIKETIVTKPAVILRPISNLRVPPRPAGGPAGKPRLKLELSEEGFNTHRAKGIYSELPAHQRPRTVSLEERFKLQASRTAKDRRNTDNDCVFPRKTSSNKPLSKIAPCSTSSLTSLRHEDLATINMSTGDDLSIVDVHTPTSSFSIPHSLVQDNLQSLFKALEAKVDLNNSGVGNASESVGRGWIKYAWNDTVWNMDDDSDYTIFAWRQKSLSPDQAATLYLHNPNHPLPRPHEYCNPSYYAFKNPSSFSSLLKPRSPSGTRSVRSSKSRRSVHSGQTEEDDGILQHKKAFMKFHNENGVRTVLGSIGPVKDVRMLLKSGYRHVYISRAFAKKHGFIPADAKPGLYGYGGLVNIGTWPVTVGKTKTSHSVFLSEETHFDCILGRSFMELRGIKTDPIDPTNIVCLDTGEKLECELVIIRDGNGEIVTVT